MSFLLLPAAAAAGLLACWHAGSDALISTFAQAVRWIQDAQNKAPHTPHSVHKLDIY
jgi:hypothetical protein